MKHEATADVAFVNRLEKALAVPGVLERPEVRQRINVITLAAALKSIEQPASPDDKALCEALELHAFDDCGERVVETHLCNQAASRIRQLSAQVKALEAERDEARAILQPIDKGMQWPSVEAMTRGKAFLARKAGEAL